MKLAEKKDSLMNIVQDADEKLTGLLIALANEYNTSDFEFTDEEIEKFYEIRDNLLAEPESGYSPEKAHEAIRNKTADGI